MMRSKSRVHAMSQTIFLVIIAGNLLTIDSLALSQGHHRAVPFDDDLEGDSEFGEAQILSEFSSVDRARIRNVANALEDQLSLTAKTMSLPTVGLNSRDLQRSVVVSKPASCDGFFCPAGRVCAVTDTKPHCICRESCPAKRNSVCGTDGNVYTSHCELHRAACIQHRHISVDHTGNSCNNVVNVFTTVVTVGNSIELKCGTNRTGRLSWKRNGNPLGHLNTNEIKVYDDGSLYIGNLALYLMGNYTCHDESTGMLVQKHQLIIQDPPHVFVHPRHQSCQVGSSVRLRCHSLGVPQPEIIWKHKGQTLDDDLEAFSNDRSEQHVFLRNNSILELQSVQETGSYECYAKNAAGVESRSMRVTVDLDKARTSDYGEEKNSEPFVVFHDRGYTVYEVGQCHVERQVSGEFALSSVLTDLDANTLGTLCPGGESCSWGDAVTAGGLFLYVSQPAQKRIIVVDIKERFNPVEVIIVDGHPISLDYVAHLDQMWVTCLIEMIEGAAKMAMMLRDAGKTQRHHPIHLQSDSGDTITALEGLFVPSTTDLGSGLLYGYSVPRGQMALQKLDLVSLKYIAAVSLVENKCNPTAGVVIPIGGYVMINCESSNVSTSSADFLLVLDYVADAVLFKFSVGGKIYVSPDSRYVVVLAKNGKTISAFKISDSGYLEHSFDEYLEIEVVNLSFVPSETGFEYSVYGVSFSQSTILVLDLSSGKASLIEGVNPSSRPVWWAPVKRNHVVSCAAIFADHVVVTGDASMTTFEIGARRAQCTWDDVQNGRIVVPVPHSG